MTEKLTAADLQERVGGGAWRVLNRGVTGWFASSSHADAAALVAVALAECEPARVDVDIRAGGVRVRLAAGVDATFAEADARALQAVALAAEQSGLRSDPSVVQDLQVSIDTADVDSIRPFWAEALGYRSLGEDDLVDPLRRGPDVWFQPSDDDRPLRNRLHVDAVRPAQVGRGTRERLAGVGGSETFACDFYATVADADGNEVDLVPLVDADRLETPGTEDWRAVFAATACYEATPNQAASLAEHAAALADAAGVELRIAVRDGWVVLDSGKDLWEDERFGPLAAAVQHAAGELGVRPRPERSAFVQVVIDAADVAGLQRFWSAALGYLPDPRAGVTDLVDPTGFGMPLVFQNLEADPARQGQRNRMHLDLFVPDDQAQQRIDAALAAGGRLVSDAHAPHWWTLADAEGNELDIVVIPGRAEAHPG